MKAKTIDNSPYGFDTCIYDNEDYPMGYCVEDLPDKERADKYTSIFNLELSAHVSKETSPLLAEIDRLKSEVEKIDYAYNSLAQKYNNAVEEVERLEFMIEHGLGPEDMVNDITMPHEI